ncbi:unnamed protein product [Soboliphyme baturini]|uniref:Secreted protein n=1 Tax=Soboliphyme baturini TaxID=241478 RepID=A0A183IVL6_9BILA|nr:unnamed protein product [Soboliphyme baturini]
MLYLVTGWPAGPIAANVGQLALLTIRECRQNRSSFFNASDDDCSVRHPPDHTPQTAVCDADAMATINAINCTSKTAGRRNSPE